MKTILKLLFLSVIGIWVTSCEILVQEPETAVTNPNVWSNEADAVSVFNSMQYWIRAQASYSHTWTSGELRGRISVSNVLSTLTYCHNYNNAYDLHTTSAFYNWAHIYNAIALANLIIDNVESVPMDKSKIDYLRGGAYFTRAFAYFLLLRFWGEAPLIASSEDVTTIAKSTKQEIFAQIVKDAEQAKLRLNPWSRVSEQFGSVLSSKQYPCEGSVDALMTHAYAWMGSIENNDSYIEEAIAAATNLINSGEYMLVGTAEQISTEVMYGNSPEGIYELDFTDNSYERNGVAGPAYYLVGYPLVLNVTTGTSHSYAPRVYIKIYNELIDNLYDEEGDMRVESYFYDYHNQKNQFAQPFPIKWRKPLYSVDGNNTLLAFDANLVYFRLADILLLRAECYNKLGQTSPAIADLNTVRARAGLDGYNAAVNGDLKLSILKERRRELWFEGHLFFDLIRNDELKNMVSTFSEMTQDDINDGCYYLPVPSGAFTKNPAMRQNIYWKRNGF